MSLPQLLLVDDSEAVLAFERAALAGHFAVATATDGREALRKMGQLRPAAVLLDLSMPHMDGDEVLARMQANAELRRIPVVIVSSERQRAEACLKAGAKAFLPKPIRAKDLLPLVSRVLEEARSAERAGNLAALFVVAGSIELGIPLASVETVIHQVATRARGQGPRWLAESVEIHGTALCVLDLPLRLGVEHSVPLDQRKLVVLTDGAVRLAVSVDHVRDPVELPASDLTPPDRAPGHEALRAALVAFASTPQGSLPIVRPHALLPPELLRGLPALVGAP